MRRPCCTSPPSTSCDREIAHGRATIWTRHSRWHGRPASDSSAPRSRGGWDGWQIQPKTGPRTYYADASDDGKVLLMEDLCAFRPLDQVHGMRHDQVVFTARVKSRWLKKRASLTAG